MNGSAVPQIPNGRDGHAINRFAMISKFSADRVQVEQRLAGMLVRAGLLRHFKKEIQERNNLDLIVKKKNTIPYLVDQHLLDKKNA